MYVGDLNKMNCSKCEAKLLEAAQFCHTCGANATAGSASIVASAADLAQATEKSEGSKGPAEKIKPAAAVGLAAEEVSSEKRIQQASPKERFLNASAAYQNNEQDYKEHEEEQWQGTYSKNAMLSEAVGAFLASLVLLIGGAFAGGLSGFFIGAGLAVLVWIGLWLLLMYRQLSIHYYLTTQRFIHEQGLLWRTIDRIELIDIDDVNYSQGPIERILNIGTITVSSSDKTHPLVVLAGIQEVRLVTDQIDDLRRAERRRRGLHIESI